MMPLLLFLFSEFRKLYKMGEVLGNISYMNS